MSLSQVIRRARDACPSWHAGLVAALLLGFCGLAGAMLLQLRTQAWNQAKVDANNTVATLSRDIDRNVELYDLSLQAVIRGLQLPDLPLLRPAIVASLVYSFVRAMTAVSAVIFLVTAEYNMATAYIVGRVEAGEFGLAIAYSCVLIAIMLAVIGLIQFGVGERKLGRRAESVAPMPAGA